MSKTVNTRVKLKYDTYDNWDSVGSTFTPLKGEVIYYSDLSKFKVGDGSTALNDLSYFAPNLADVATSGSYNDLSDTPTIDTTISSTSTNALQNKVIYTALSGKQASLTTAQLNACNSGITSTKVTTYDGYASQISGKQDKLTAGSNITISGTTISSSYTDTKNTAGATAFGITGAPYYLIGASTQSDNPQTYSSAYCYIQTGSLYSNKHRVAETYTEDDEHYISTEAGFYKISGASTKNSDGTYNYVTILTTDNIAEKGLFVPMTGTINTPMSGGIHQKIAYDIQTSSGGLTPAGGGSATTSTRYAESFYGEKGFEYVYYGKDANYGTNDSTAVGSYGITYKPFDSVTNSGYYTTVDILLNEGLNIWRVYTNGYGTNTGSVSFSDYLECLSLLPNATIKYKSSGSSTTTTVDLKNLQTKLVSGTSIKTINSKSLLGSGNLAATDIIPTATVSEKGIAYLSGFQKVDGTGYATSGYFFDTETGWMICYGTTGSISGAGNIVTFAKSFVGAPLVVVSPFTKSTTETTISTQYRNACTVRCYRNTSGTASSSYNASTYYGSFILDTGNSESGYFSYIAIGRFK